MNHLLELLNDRVNLIFICVKITTSKTPFISLEILLIRGNYNRKQPKYVANFHLKSNKLKEEENLPEKIVFRK